jgi:thiamine kinase-like enzyme
MIPMALGCAHECNGTSRRPDLTESLDMDQLAVALRRIPFLVDVDPRSAVRLAGLTNINHLVAVGDVRYVVRVPGDGTSDYIDRHTEEVAARSAAAAGVSAEVEFFDAADGLMVTRFIDGARTMDAAAFRDSASLQRAGEVLQRLHSTAEAFSNNFDLFGMIDEYRALLVTKGAELPEGYDDLQRAADEARHSLALTRTQSVPSHCDPLCENFLDTGTRMYLIDYEYAGNNDPMWDLADLSVEGGFDAMQDEILLTAYLGYEPHEAERGRMVAYKALCDLLWTLWGVIQHANGNPAEDFWAYATGRFERCRLLMEDPSFRDHLVAIRTGIHRES